MPFNRFGYDATLEDVVRERLNDTIAIDQLERGKLQGRYRTDRAVPSAFDDLQQGDAIGDRVFNALYEYELIRHPTAGVVWRRSDIGSVSW
jgi:hypothetical protein